MIELVVAQGAGVVADPIEDSKDRQTLEQRGNRGARDTIASIQNQDARLLSSRLIHQRGNASCAGKFRGLLHMAMQVIGVNNGQGSIVRPRQGR